MFKLQYKKALETLLRNINELKKHKNTDVIYAQLLVSVGGLNYGLMRKRVLENIDTAKRENDYKKVLALETILLNIDDIEHLVLMEHIRRLTGEE